VRIMKDRKHMTHTDLVNEVIRQLLSKFNPELILIKRRIENLIEVGCPSLHSSAPSLLNVFFRENIWSDATIANLIITWLVFLL